MTASAWTASRTSPTGTSSSEYKDLARDTWRERCAAQGVGNGADARFLVVGEELREPLDLLRQQRLDGLWHEQFKRYIRAALLGQNAGASRASNGPCARPSIAGSFGYSDGAQAIIYLTSHDVEGFRNERLLNFLHSNGIFDAEKRIKLAFACLLTAVGMPMILAGEEFADQHDLFDAQGHISQEGGKQVDPVNFTRLSDAWRRRDSGVCCPSDQVQDHERRPGGQRHRLHPRRFQRRQAGAGLAPRSADSDTMVVVVANFSDFGTAEPFSPGAEYHVPNWPALPPGKQWREITQERDVPPEWAGREPIFPWEAKVYAVV